MGGPEPAGVGHMTADGNATLTLDRVTIRIGDTPLIEEMTETVGPGEILTLMGPSGSGKSSLLAYLSGSLDPVFSASGRVLLGERDVTTLPIEHRRIGVLFQDDLLFAHMSIGQNLAFAVPRHIRGPTRKALVADALREAELEGFEDRDPATLSGGQRARVSLMRALLAEPQAILLDEPFSKLDAALRGRIRQFTAATIAKREIPAVLVTHDREDVMDRVVSIHAAHKALG